MNSSWQRQLKLSLLYSFFVDAKAVCCTVGVLLLNCDLHNTLVLLQLLLLLLLLLVI